VGDVVPRDGFVGSEYVEVYAGGANVALNLLFEEYASRVYVNDLLSSSRPTRTKLTLRFPTFFLNRTARSGITGAAISGKDQAGPTKGASQRCLKRAYPFEA
jgi:hypothetical protein